jgi:hypothetical protein
MLSSKQNCLGGSARQEHLCKLSSFTCDFCVWHALAARLQTAWAAFAAYTSLGIIYVDIGTSPLYTYATTLGSSSNSSSSPLPPAKEDVLGVASLIFWILTLVVLVKYVLILLRADDSGEGRCYSRTCRRLPAGDSCPASSCCSMTSGACAHHTQCFNQHASQATQHRHCTAVPVAAHSAHVSQLLQSPLWCLWFLPPPAGGTFALYSLLCRSIGLTPFGAEVHKADCDLSRYNSMPRRRRTGLGAT